MAKEIAVYEDYKKVCNCWDDLYEAHNFFYEDVQQAKYKWIFRGENYYDENEDSKKLETAFKSSLDEAFKRFDVENDNREEIEKKLNRSFRRKAHLYSVDRVADLLESLALLRHYEGPARMLDWSYSFFVAIYWAVARAKANDNLAVWALNNNWLGKKNKNFEKNLGKTKKYKKIAKLEDPADKSSIGLGNLINLPKPFIYAVNPYYLNERLSIQQGVLLVQGEIKKSWGENLKDMIRNGNNQRYGTLLWKISIKLNIKGLKKVLSRLYSMNISKATLFPDLGGFAQSLTNRIALGF